MLLAGVLSIAIRAYFWHDNPRKTKEKRNWSNIDISVLFSTDRTHRYQKSCKQPCHGHFKAMPKGQNFVVFLLAGRVVWIKFATTATGVDRKFEVWTCVENWKTDQLDQRDGHWARHRFQIGEPIGQFGRWQIVQTDQDSHRLSPT